MVLSIDTKNLAYELVYEMIRQGVIVNKDNIDPEIIDDIIEGIKLDMKN